jgi:hypothetical protein
MVGLFEIRISLQVAIPVLFVGIPLGANNSSVLAYINKSKVLNLFELFTST